MATPRRRAVPDDLISTNEVAALLHCTPGAPHDAFPRPGAARLPGGQASAVLVERSARLVG